MDSTQTHSNHMENLELTIAERNILNNIVESYYHITSMVGTDVREAKELAQKSLKAFEELEQADKSLAKMLRDIVAIQQERDELKTKLQQLHTVFRKWDNIDVKTLPAVAMHASYKEAFDPGPPVATLSFDGESEDVTDQIDSMHRGWKALEDANDRIKVLEQKLTGKDTRIVNLQVKLQKTLATYDAEVIGRREEVTKCHAEMGRLRADNEFLQRYYNTAEKNSQWVLQQIEKLADACDLLEKWNLRAWQYDGDYEQQLQQDTCNFVVARELDTKVAKMQTPEAKAAAKALFTGEFGGDK